MLSLQEKLILFAIMLASAIAIALTPIMVTIVVLNSYDWVMYIKSLLDR